MYLKSIEMQGFKSFANKIVLDFHDGITGIVGPNGSGKSNVADAVRWVLGEQSAKQLRGASMQDVIFSGTENRRALGFAYVAITMDNSDHTLPVEYKEVTVSRRVYRSGESEYMINQVPCRLKDVQELFFDTGVGKEGYSIIGQGQIDKILSGKPEDRRELFDEAVGIVKYKKRKEAAEKKLANEHDNLLRVNDILVELEGRVLPLQEQSETAKKYLKLKEDLKKLDVNMYIQETERIENDKEKTKLNGDIVQKDLLDNQNTLEKIKQEYSELEQKLRESEESIEGFRIEENKIIDEKNEVEKQISILQEQIKMSKTSDEDLGKRIEALVKEKCDKEEQMEGVLKEKAETEAVLTEIRERLKAAVDKKNDVEGKIRDANDRIDVAQNRIVEILRENAEIKSEEQKYSTMREQANIKKASLVKQMIERKSDEENLLNLKSEKEDNLKKCNDSYLEIVSKRKELEQKSLEWETKKAECEEKSHELLLKIKTSENSLEALKNMAERYEGFGNSVKTVMEEKDRESGLIGVVSDLISVDKKYEVAIETALGGNIQNIVTEDEATAKRMIATLKEKRAGRATFLPLTSVHPEKDRFNNGELDEKGVIGVASDLVDTESRFKDVIKYLVGRVLVIDTMDNALKFAKAHKYKEHIVTLEGEYLRPGGSLTGGAFKNKNNLLSRTRRLEKLTEDLKKNKEEFEETKTRLSEIQTAFELNKSDLKDVRVEENQAMISLNTAKIEFDQAEKKLSEQSNFSNGIEDEKNAIEKELVEIESKKKEATEKLADLDEEQKTLNKTITDLRDSLDSISDGAPEAGDMVSKIRIEESNSVQKLVFIEENEKRIKSEIEKAVSDIERMQDDSKNSATVNEEKAKQIEELNQKIFDFDNVRKVLTQKREQAIQDKDDMDSKYKGFFDRRAEVADRINALDRDLYRLKSKYQKLTEELEYQNNYMWEEYELTLHSAMALRDEETITSTNIKKDISNLKEEIRKMGNVNVNAIEEYKEVSERYEFLKKQHDDLIEAEDALKKIIDDLDEGMRQQFAEGFKDIQREFDKAFKDLFGGGKGTLELCEDEDILETGIKIIAQPPGKKLINMMQMSGGEKALTAIALLFAIQHLKPSPFCLLDEIEAALDDSNVDRFANYLKNLTKNTQFIVITHRRGTMNAADRLYGITMQEKGVSVLVSVNLIENQLDA
ncbi:MAG: chromosome segregation protein SMC [Lachnospiraceae bacterium]|nr:chromosome segregation protein SMC [Lachnospiraceae bacterium]